MATFVSHHVGSLFAAYYVFLCAVTALPAPNGSGNFYRWFYSFLHLIAGNLPNIVKAFKNSNSTLGLLQSGVISTNEARDIEAKKSASGRPGS